MKSYPNEGAARLATCGSQRAIAAQLGVSHQLVGKWISGRAVPPHETRQRVATLFGVATEAWDRAAPTAPLAPPPAAGPTGDDEAPEAARARLLAQAERLRALRGDPTTTPRARLELERVELRVSAELARIDGSILSSEQIAAHPAFAALETEILGALESHPLALFAVAAALRPEADHGKRAREEHPELVAAVEAANAALLAALRTSAAAAKSRAA